MISGPDGRRKYLTNDERSSVLDFASRESLTIYTFCFVLAATGCRVSEALTLTLTNVDRNSQCIVIESLKKRRRGIYRTVPVPRMLIEMLFSVHGHQDHERRLWSWSRMTAWRRVNEAMSAAGVRGLQASPKGFRHGFGVSAIQSGVPLNMVQKWLGHADLRTTAIYTCATGPEEVGIAERMWSAMLPQ
jgi:integrase